MPVFRVEKNSNYTTMCNYHLRDQGLSLKGKGLLSMLLSLPDTWNYSVRGLSSITPDGVDGVLTALKELERLGYLERNQQRESNGRMGRAEYVIYEMPRKKPCTEKPYTVNPDTDTPVTENPAQLSTNRTSTETINKRGRRKSSTGMAHTKMSFSLTRNTASSGRSSQEIIRCGWNGSLSIRFELSFMNMATDASNFEKMVRIPYQKDHFNPVRTEYSTMLRRQLAQGNNGLTKTKYLTFGIEAESMKQAKPRLNHIEIDLMNNFKRLGVRAKLLNGKERLHLMHDMFHMGDHDRFNFDWKWLPESGLSVKDFIAPTGFAFPKNRVFQMGGMYGSMSYLQITASDLSDQLLKDFLDMESSQIVTMHIQSVDQNKAIKSIKHTITELDRSKIEEQKKAVRSGYDMDIIPSDLATYGRDAKALLKELQSQNERMFLLTFLVMNTGETEQELETNVFQASSIAQKYNCNLRRLDFQQEQGLMSCLPLAQNLIEIQRSMTTSSTAIFVPFTTQELFQTGKEALYYGLNALSNNLIMVDRKKLKNPNGLILGTPGSGKSFSAKREIANAFLVTDDDVIVCDPEAEYTALVKKFEGQVIKISPSSAQYINPMDINANYSEEDTLRSSVKCR